MGGLFVASRSGVHAPVGYWGGLVFFAIALLIVFYLVKLALDEAGSTTESQPSIDLQQQRLQIGRLRQEGGPDGPARPGGAQDAAAVGRPRPGRAPPARRSSRPSCGGSRRR
jgi:hypothetical protein